MVLSTNGAFKHKRGQNNYQKKRSQLAGKNIHVFATHCHVYIKIDGVPTNRTGMSIVTIQKNKRSSIPSNNTDVALVLK